jgi:hypothetical protein
MQDLNKNENDEQEPYYLTYTLSGSEGNKAQGY